MSRSLFFALIVSFGFLMGPAASHSSDLPLALEGEDCVRFNPETVQVEAFGSRFRLMDGSHALMVFDDEQEANQALEVMRHYQFNRSCYVGRPGPSLQYFLVDDQAPTGAMDGEDCVRFDPEQVDARRVQGSWKIVQNGQWLMDFADARIQSYIALAIIRHHGFSHYCFVARPDPAMTYLRRGDDASVALSSPAAPHPEPEPQPEPEPSAPPAPVSSLLSLPQENLVLHLDAAHDFSEGVWLDQSGAEHHAEQPNPDRRPQVLDNAVGGHPALAFDGENDVLVSSLDINPDVNPDITVFMVFDSRIGDRVHRKLFGHDNGGFDRAVGLDSRSGKNLVFFGGSRGRTTSIVDIEADQWYLLTMMYTRDSASAWINGEQVADAVRVNNGRGESVTMIGNGGAGSSEWWGSIAEMVVYSADLPASQRQAIETALLDKYGL